MKETRYLTVEVRAEENAERGSEIMGYPIVFDQEIDMGEWRETIGAEAFEDATILRDVALLIGHDFGTIPLAHSRRNNGSGTMTLTPDALGVQMRAVLDTENNPKAKEAYSAVKRRDISGMSFAFIVDKETWEDLDTDKPLRRITGFKRIFEVSLVAFPAYSGTSVQAAAEGEALESVKASMEIARQHLQEIREEEAEEERRKAALERLEQAQRKAREQAGAL